MPKRKSPISPAAYQAPAYPGRPMYTWRFADMSAGAIHITAPSYTAAKRAANRAFIWPLGAPKAPRPGRLILSSGPRAARRMVCPVRLEYQSTLVRAGHMEDAAEYARDFCRDFWF